MNLHDPEIFLQEAISLLFSAKKVASLTLNLCGLMHTMPGLTARI